MKALSHEMNTFHDKKEMYHPGTSGTWTLNHYAKNISNGLICSDPV
jgi:hypothetical protein